MAVISTRHNLNFLSPTMIGLGIVWVTFFSTALLWDVGDCRPAGGLDDFRIDDEISLSNDGSGLGETVELGSNGNGIQLSGSGDEEDSEESGSASGEDESEEDIDLGSTGPDIIIGSSESTKSTSVITPNPVTEPKTTDTLIPSIDVTVVTESTKSTSVITPNPVTEPKTTDTLIPSIDVTVVTESTKSTSVITPNPVTEPKTKEMLIPSIDVTVVTDIPVLIGPDDRGSGHPPLPSTNTESPSPSTTVKDGGDLIEPEDRFVDVSGSGSGSGVDTIDSDQDEESSSAGIIVPDSKSSLGPPVTSSSIFPEEEDEQGSTDQTDFTIDRTLSNLPSESGSGIIADVEPPRLSSLPSSHTLSPGIVITEEFLPVTSRKSTASQKYPTTYSSSPTTWHYVDTNTIPPPVVELTLGHGVPDESTAHTTLEDTSLTISSDHRNHTVHIKGRRRKPGHTDTTFGHTWEVSVGAISEEDEEKEDKKVSYFAVIAAALIAGIIFFILGYITSKLKNRKEPLKLPWKKGKMNMEATADAGNGSAVQVYRDEHPEKYTPVHPEVGGSKDLVEVHPKPKDLNISDTNVASPSIPMTELSPESTEDQKLVSGGDAETKVDELKYIDETDEELEPVVTIPLLETDEEFEPVVTTPLLEEEEVLEADRGDLASQVLNTVEKNLNAVSENDLLLPPPADAITSNGVDTIGEDSTR